MLFVQYPCFDVHILLIILRLANHTFIDSRV